MWVSLLRSALQRHNFVCFVIYVWLANNNNKTLDELTLEKKKPIDPLIPRLKTPDGPLTCPYIFDVHTLEHKFWCCSKPHCTIQMCLMRRWLAHQMSCLMRKWLARQMSCLMRKWLDHQRSCLMRRWLDHQMLCLMSRWLGQKMSCLMRTDWAIKCRVWWEGGCTTKCVYEKVVRPPNVVSMRRWLCHQMSCLMRSWLDHQMSCLWEGGLAPKCRVWCDVGCTTKFRVLWDVGGVQAHFSTITDVINDSNFMLH